MNAPSTEQELQKTRASIAKRVRDLRKERHWTQAELAKRLQLSQARVSEIEGGDGSFTAEQFLLLLKLFNVAASHFAPTQRNQESEIQNALARLGAIHLRESDDVLPSERLDDVRSAVRETLVLADSPRLITALAPVLVRNAERINLNKLQLELSEAGLARRLPWLVENVREAIDRQEPEKLGTLSRAWVRLCRRAYVLLGTFLEAVSTDPRLSSPDALGAWEVLDSNIRSKQSKDEVIASSSPISQRWRIVTNIQVEDFAHALRSARGAD